MLYTAPSEIQEGQETQVLSLIWQIILRYQITDSGEGPQKLLLSWLRACLPDLDIDNLTTDWKDGFLISSLVNFCDSSLIIDHLWLDRDEALENVENALKLAEEHFKIPQLLQPEDLVCKKPDENCIMTYLSYFYNGAESPGQKMLLEWIQEQTNDESITDFSDAWLDGKKLALLVAVVSSSGLDKYHEASDKDDKLEVCKEAMESAEHFLGISPTITPSQFLDHTLNTVLRMLYIMQFFFSTRQARVHELHLPEEPGRGATVWLDISLPEGSTSKVEAFVRGKLTEDVTPEVVSSGDGKYRIKFDAEVPDCYSLTVSVGGMRVKGSPFAVNLMPSNPDSIELTNTVLPQKAGIPVLMTFTAKEANHRKLTADARGELSGEVPHSVDMASSTVYKVSFIPLQSENYYIDVKLDGLHIKGSPFTFPLTDLIQPEVITIGEPKKGLVGEIVTIPIDTRDAGKDELHAKCSGKVAGNVEIVYHPPDNPAEITFTPPMEDTYSVSIFFGTTEIIGSPFDIKIFQHPVDAQKVSLINPPSGAAKPGNEIKIGFDCSEAGEGKMTASCTGKSLGDVNVRVIEKPNYLYDVILVPPEIDNFNIDVLWSGKPIPGSPFNMNLVPKDAPDPSKCKVINFPDKDAILLTNKMIFFKVDATEAGKGYLDVVVEANKSEQEDDQVSVVSTGTYGSELTNMEHDGEEVQEMEPIREDIDEHEDQPVGEREGKEIGGREVEEKEEDEDGAKKESEEKQEDDATEDRADDEDKKPKDGDESKADSKDNHEEVEALPTLTIDPRKDNPKIYEVSYMPVHAMNHIMNVYWDDQHIPGSPFSFRSYEAQYVKFNEPISVRIKTKYKRKHLKVKLEKKDRSVVKKPNTKMEKVTAGDYIVILTPEHPDIYLLHITAKNKPVTGSPFVINYYQREVSIEQLLDVEVRPPSEEAIVGQPISFTIRAADTSLIDMLSVSRRPSYMDEASTAADISAVHLERRGKEVTVQYTPTSVGEEDLEFRIGEHLLTGSPFHISVVDKKGKAEARAAQASPPKSPKTSPSTKRKASIFGLQIDDQKFVVDSQSKFKLFCKDLGEGKLEVFSKPSSHASIEVQLDESEETVYWVTITPKKQGKTELIFRFGGNDIDGSPFRVVFLARGNAKKSVLLSTSDCPPNPNEGEKTFCVSTKGAGKGKITAYMKSLTNDKFLEVKVEQHTKHHYHLTFSPTEGLNYMLTVKLDDIDINGSPYKVLLGNPFHCKAEGEGLVKPWCGMLNKFCINSTNAGPGDLSVLIERDEEEGDSQKMPEVKAQTSKLEDFKYEVSYTPTAPGYYWITVKWHDTHISGSPFKTLCRVPLSSSNLSVVEPVDITHLNKRAEMVVKVDQVIEESDKLSVVVHGGDDGRGHPLPVPGEVARKSDQSYAISILPPNLGNFSVHVLWEENHISGSPFEIANIPPPSASEFTIKAVEKEMGVLFTTVIGPKYSFRYGELTASILSKDMSASDEVVVKTSTVSDEECTVSFKLGPGRKYELNIFYDKEHIQGSPFSLIATDALQCYHKGKGLATSHVNQPSSFTVFTENAGPGELKVDIDAVLENEESVSLSSEITARSSGTAYDVTYTPNFTGLYKMSVYWDAHHIPGSPFDMVCCDPARYSIATPPKEGCLGKPIKIGVKEATLSPSYEKLEIYARGKDQVHLNGAISSGDDGNYFCTVQPPELGKYVVHVRCNGYDITGSPFKIKNMPAPVPEKVVVSGPGIEDGHLGEKGSFLIDVSEAGHGYVHLKIQGPKRSFNTYLTESKEKHKLLAEYNPTHAGKYSISVLWSGVHVPNSPFSVNIDENNTGRPRLTEPGPVTMKSVM